MHSDGHWWASVAEIHQVCGLNPSTIYLYADQYGWPKIKHDGRNYFRWQDVAATLRPDGRPGPRARKLGPRILGPRKLDPEKLDARKLDGETP